MSSLFLAEFWSDFAAGFGAAAAILAVGGFILLRFQRNRQEFALLREAIDTGDVDDLSSWRLAMRQGLMTLALGVGLLIAGAGALFLGHQQADLSALPTSQPADVLLHGPKPRDPRGRLTAEGRLYSAAREQVRHARRLELAGFMLCAAGTTLLLLGGMRTFLARADRDRAAKQGADAKDPVDQGSVDE